ncbi:hypothetical protein FIBSPDRAFT_933857 [Athelia psychrophila]|uniref:DUF7918 domain-containing protein n=1 Tax=Athelia psychrophila TaxID=1759441 RepID=A0A166GAG4_9AGAM|nr:hypothetical protein FIBSPDRAFT_933857 [Fibularhizoctonia sp. CBS 109695]
MPLELDGITAGIHCEGVELECYNVEKSHDGKTMTCWVVSEVGKTFTIVYSMPSKHGMDPTISDVYVDGFQAGGINMRARSKPSNGSKTYTYSGCRTSATTMRPFTFVKIRVTDADSMEYHNPADMGNIALKISTARLRGDRLRSYKHAEGLGGQTVHERAKKTCSHSIDLGNEIKLPKRKNTITEQFIGQDQIAEFIFRYRPLAQGIVPHVPQRQPSPSPKAGTAPPSRTNSPKAFPGIFNVKRDAGVAARISAVRIKFPTISVPSKVKREDRADVDDAALTAEIQAADDKLRKLRTRERKMALLKELAELKSDGDSGPSTPQRPAKRVKRVFRHRFDLPVIISRRRLSH